MNKKFFALINTETIRSGSSKKVIPASEVTTLLSAKEVLEIAKKDAEQYKKEVVQEVEKLKSQAELQGYEEGFKKWAEQVTQLEKEILRVREDVEKMIVPIALKAAKKIVQKEIEQSPDTIVEIVSANLKAVSQHKQITIYVNKKDLDHLESQKPRLKEIFEKLESLSIRARSDIEPGGCMIETEGGIINAQLENRWKVLENAFEALTKAEQKKAG